jgi:hypothetical protein
VVIDPENRIADANRANNSAKLPAFEIGAIAAAGGSGPQGGTRPATGPRERAQMSLVAGTCLGLRLSSGTEQSCGGADLEVELATQGGGMRLTADGIRNLGTVQLDQVTQLAAGSLTSSEVLQRGSTYLVKTSRGLVLVRVAEVNGLESVRNAGPVASRPSLNGRFDREPAAAPQPKVTLVLEFRAVQ